MSNNKRIIYYIEDNIRDLGKFQKNVSDQITNIEIKEFDIEKSKEIIEKISNFLDPTGADPAETIEKAKKYLDKLFKNVKGFVLDYELTGLEKNYNITGPAFYEKYILENDELKDLNVLFLTHFSGDTSKELIEIRKKIVTDYDQTKVYVLSKKSFGITESKVIAKKIQELFHKPVF